VIRDYTRPQISLKSKSQREAVPCRAVRHAVSFPFSPRRPGFETGAGHVGFVVDRASRGRLCPSTSVRHPGLVAGQTVADVASGPSVAPREESKRKRQKKGSEGVDGDKVATLRRERERERRTGSEALSCDWTTLFCCAGRCRAVRENTTAQPVCVSPARMWLRRGYHEQTCGVCVRACVSGAARRHPCLMLV
jgi:hypothetical protein